MPAQRLVVGSTAMNGLGLAHRQARDLDVLTPRQEAGADTYWHPRLEEWIEPGTDRAADLDELYTLKVSHSYWELKNGSWAKHVFDAVQLKKAGAAVVQPLHDLLYSVWEERHGKKQVDLSQESDEFFADAVNRKYDHDSIHASVAYGKEPMYVRILKEGHSVAVDMLKLKALSFEDKVQLFREEVYATALERLVIPSDYRHSLRTAYDWALRRTITSLTKGWSAQFLVENYDTFRKPDVDYVARHLANHDKLIPLEEK
ncbi:hypothetical protein [Saccharothrix sp. HUAS TT1]|uniref:DUF7275 domain-containing protein n=1 Tax=unclassified Saccharothrix TaxID=2593673 RepID=UPI00345B61EA